MGSIKTRITKLLTSKPELLQNLNLSPRRVLLLVNHLIENGVTIRERGRWEPHPNHPGFDRALFVTIASSEMTGLTARNGTSVLIVAPISEKKGAKKMSDKTNLGKGVRFERIRRITGYLVGTMDRWNNAKRAEERDRVKHNISTVKGDSHD